MTTPIITITQALQKFIEEIDNLINFDEENQRNFSSTIEGSAGRIRKRQLHLLTEAIFFSAHRAYEHFVRDIFLLYCMQEKPKSGSDVISYLKAKDTLHAEQLIKSSLPFLDWTSPDIVISRSETYLENGFPVKLPYAAKKQTLIDLKHLRNHIAHNSSESLQGYIKVLRRHYTVVPLTIPKAGEFLLVSEKKNRKRYKLLTYLIFFKDIAKDLT